MNPDSPSVQRPSALSSREHPLQPHRAHRGPTRRQEANAIQSSIRMNHLEHLNVLTPDAGRLAQAALATVVKPTGPVLPE